MKRTLPFLIWSLLVLPLMAQHTIKGIITDAQSGEVLPFVNIIVNNDPYTGTISDIDGRFKFTVKEEVRQLTITYIGYKKRIVKIDPANVPTFFDIKLEKEQVQLNEVVVLPGENPAHRIIKKVIENKSVNDPERLQSYKYTAYNKFIVTAKLPEKDSSSVVKKATTDTSKVDSTTIKFREHLERHHLFLMESVSERKFIRPDLNNEKVVASRVSGFKEPNFFLLATQFQSFSFYNDHIALLDRNFLNPISAGSLSKYIFILEDTIYSQQDTVFVISYLPRKNKNFDGLKGLLYINTNTFAIQNVIAEPAEELQIGIKVRQFYEFVDNKQWFPVQLNTDILFKGIFVNMHNMIGEGRTYIKDIEIEPSIRKRELSPFEAELDPNAAFRKDEYWEKHRIHELDSLERNTYGLLDTVGEELGFDEKLRWFNALTTGKLTFGKFNILVNELFKYNNYEGIRLGAGIGTSDRISQIFYLQGYGAYGFKDKVLKYGAEAGVNISRKNEVALKLNYQFDTEESGGLDFYKEKYDFQTGSLRRYLIKRMHYDEKLKFSFNIRTLKYAYLHLYLQSRTATITGDYTFFDIAESGSRQKFNFSEVGVRLKYAFREQTIFDGKKVHSLGTNYPTFWINYQKGIGLNPGDLIYNKFEVKMDHSFLIKNLGITFLAVTAGFTDASLPYFELFYPKSTRMKNSYYLVENTFNTMPVQEFLSDRMMSAFITHDFGRLLYKTENFQPSLKMTTGFALGTLNNSSFHEGVTIKTLDKGYFESGLIINDILKAKYFNLFHLGLGIGAFYRYGPYNTGKLKEDGAIRLSFTFGT